MSKIPVGHTISSAYGFAFKSFLSVLGIAWFPYVVALGLLGGMLYAISPQIALLAQGQFDVSLIGEFAGIGFLALVAFMIAGAMVTVGVMRKALGLHHQPYFIFFSLGSQVWRMIGAYILAFLVIIGVMTVIGGAIAVFGMTLGKSMGTGGGLLTGLLACLAALWYIYMIVRLIFFLPAIVVAEGHTGLRHSWHLGKGNFWRIFIVMLAVTIPVAIAFSVIQSVISGPQPTPDMTNPSPQQAMELLAHQMQTIGPAMLVLYLAYMILISGLSAGAIAAAYRSVTAPAAPQAAPPAA